MAAYVDSARRRVGRRLAFYLWADSLSELLAMADAIGVARDRLQGAGGPADRDGSWLHFDISAKERRSAIALGAALTDKYGPLEHVARLQIASGDPEQIGVGWNRLRQIERCRRGDLAR
ncbi:MAG: DUF4031 domain-containing protein [Methylocystis sp.]|nr:DUF4031 domain-containing protein [Methylocystis sp.]